MKTLTLTIECPLPDDATEDDATALAESIQRNALTNYPTPRAFMSMLVYGKITEFKLKDGK